MNEKDFYPTPFSLFSKMKNLVETKELRTVLEPSAGKGDLIKYLSETQRRDLSIDAIEIDDNLQALLKGKNYNVIHDDFLSFKTFKKYDLIFANFPFSDGDKHLLKAIEIQENLGGEIVCLLNAETIRNPYTRDREFLLGKLSEYEAQVTYLENEFIDAERKTDVSVALIQLRIKTKPESLVIDFLEKADEISLDEFKNNQIEKTGLINSLVSRFDFEAKVGTNLISEYEKLKPYIMSSITSEYKQPILELKVKSGYGYDSETDIINDFMKSLRYKYWRIFVSNPEVREKYTSNITRELEGKLTSLSEKDFTEFNLKSLFDELNENIGKDINETIINLFDQLSYQNSYNNTQYEKNIHYYNGWKTNKSWKINEKVIIPMNGYSSYTYKDRLDTYRIIERLNDLIKSMNYLNGTAKPYSCGNLIETISNNLPLHRNIELPYVTVSFYKKGTCHVKFRDKKLLDKLNIVGSQGKGWLPPSYGKQSYSEMTKEDQKIVDEFCGQEKYAEIMKDADYYLKTSSNALLRLN